MVAFDSSFLIDALGNQGDAAAKLRELDAAGEPLTITPVSASEVLRGAHRRGGRYLDRTVEFLRGFPLLEFDLPAALASARVFSELDAAGRPLGFGDTLTAGIVLRHGERLITRDQGFSRVRGLRVERY